MSTKDYNIFLITNIKGLLQQKLWKLEERLAEKRKHSPYKNLTDAEARVFAILQGRSLSISEVARRQGKSRQAVHKIVTNLVNDGLLRLEPMSDNERDKLIVFTDKGNVLKSEAAKKLKELDAEIKHVLGSQDFQKLKKLLELDW